MPLSGRESQLINLLVNTTNTLTGKELAQLTKVSTKTIYRTIKRINETSSSGDIIYAKSGKGFSINYERYLEHMALATGDEIIVTPKERRAEILLVLLFKSPNSIKTNELFGKYYLSDSTIEGDIAYIKEILQAAGLNLRNRDRQLRIIGSEVCIRRLLNEIITTFSFGNRLEIGKLDYQLSQYDIDFIGRLVERIEVSLQTTIFYPYNVNLQSHLYILVKRIREGYIERTVDALDDSEKETIHQHQKLYGVSRDVIQCIETHIQQELPDIEAFYLFQYLLASKVAKIEGNAELRLHEKSLAVSEFILQRMSRLMMIDINKPSNVRNLLEHMDPLLYRFEQGITIENAMLEDIKSEYPREYNELKQLFIEIEEKFDLNCFSTKLTEDELGYMVLYIVKFKLLTKNRKRLLIICSSGVGTSELIKVKIRRTFPDAEIIDVLSLRQYSKAKEKYESVDLIITTIKLKEELTYPTVLVSSLLTQLDQQRITEMLGE